MPALPFNRAQDALLAGLLYVKRGLARLLSSEDVTPQQGESLATSR
jgi:hypothetical protein